MDAGTRRALKQMTHVPGPPPFLTLSHSELEFNTVFLKGRRWILANLESEVAGVACTHETPGLPEKGRTAWNHDPGVS